ncbi:MAG: hypothetical protein GY811_27375 [Myxococcales bacterium]|nr:hypothetical protein [Myxococcales bacterium]
MSAETIIVDQSDWRHIAVEGGDRVRFLNGMVSGNVQSMQDGDWLRTLMLNHKARLLSIFDVQAFANHLLVSCAPELFEVTLETLDRHIVMDDVELEVKAHPMHSCWESADAVWTARPVLEACEAGATEEAIECRRIEAGMPRFGVDVSAANFPFESQLIRLIDYEKGCFTGQEPVARVRARGGGGSKRLCGLIGGGGVLLPVGGELATKEEPKGGQVTSAVMSEQLGSIALAYVHKSAWEPGSVVKVGDLEATVSGLPFAGG